MSASRLAWVNPWPFGSPEVVEVLVDDLAAAELAALRVGASPALAYGETTSPPSTWSRVLPSGSRMSAGATPAAARSP